MLHSSRPPLVRARPFRQERFPALTIKSQFSTKTSTSPKFTSLLETDEEDDEESQDPFMSPAEKVISTYFNTTASHRDSYKIAEVAEPDSSPALTPNSSFESASSLSSEGCSTPTDDGEDPFSDFGTWSASSEVRKAVLANATSCHQFLDKSLPALPTPKRVKSIRNVRFAEEEAGLEQVKLFLKDDAPADLNLLDGEELFAKVRALGGVNLWRRNAIGKKTGRRYKGRFSDGEVQKELSPPPKFSIFDDDDSDDDDDVLIICE